MKRQSKLILNGIIGLIVIIATLAIFFLGINKLQKETIDFLSLTFVLISEIVLFGVITVLFLLNGKVNKVFLRSGIISAAVTYWIATTIVSIVLNPVYRDNISGFITAHIIIISITAIIMVGLSAAAMHIQSRDQKIMNAGLLLRDCESKVFSLLNSDDYTPVKNHLNSLFEELKFSDMSTSLPEKEREIKAKIIELSEALNAAPLNEKAASDTVQKINNIILMVKERNMEVMQIKRGGY